MIGERLLDIQPAREEAKGPIEPPGPGSAPIEIQDDWLVLGNQGLPVETS